MVCLVFLKLLSLHLCLSVSPNIVLSSDGKVEGLVNLQSISIEEASEFIKSPDSFAKFVEQNPHQVIKYFFVLYICPLNPNFISVPICIILRSNGNATQPVIQIFDKIINNLIKCGINKIGEANDGDSGWLSRVFVFAQHLYTLTLNQPDLQLEIIASISKKKNLERFFFEDLMHIIKCDRYRKVIGALLCPSLYENNPSVSQKSFIENGIPLWIVSNNRFTKMDDNLPLKFFTFANIITARNNGRFDISLSIISNCNQ